MYYCPGWNDFEILYLIREGNERAHQLMFDKYHNLIVLVAKRCGVRLLDLEDYIQEGYLCLSKALWSFKESINKTFYKYFELVLSRHFWRLRSKDKVEIYDLDGELVAKDYALKDVFINYANLFIDELDRKIFLEIYYYKTSVKELCKELNLKEIDIYQRNKKIREILRKEFDLSNKR